MLMRITDSTTVVMPTKVSKEDPSQNLCTLVSVLRKENFSARNTIRRKFLDWLYYYNKGFDVMLKTFLCIKVSSLGAFAVALHCHVFNSSMRMVGCCRFGTRTSMMLSISWLMRLTSLLTWSESISLFVYKVPDAVVDEDVLILQSRIFNWPPCSSAAICRYVVCFFTNVCTIFGLCSRRCRTTAVMSISVSRWISICLVALTH